MRKILSFLAPLFVISLTYAANLPIKVHPAIVFNPNSLTFPPSPVGTPASSQAIAVLNSGPVTVPIGSITITGTNSADFGQTNTCGASIISSASCTITVSFTPTINAAETAQLNLNASGTPGHSYSVSLMASGFVFSISSVSVTPNTFPGGSADGTPVGTIAVNVASRTNSPGFTGTLALASMANFKLSSSTLPANLLLNGTQAAGSYTAGIIPTQAGLSNSGSTFNVPITGTAPGSGPSPTLTLNVSPSSPVISATTPLNTKIADLAAVWSDASTFSGTFNFVTPNFDSGGTYAALGNGLIISPNGPGVGGAGGTTENISVQAVQGSTNSPTITVPITITSTSETVFDNGGSPWNFLNQINVVNYDQCGSGCAYVVINPVSCSSAGLTYRSDCVNFKPYSSNPGFSLGFSAAGDLYKYTISVPQTGTYALNALLSDASSGGSWAVLIDGNQAATIPTPNTGSYDTFSLSQSSSFALNAGTHVLGLRVNGGDAFNGAGDLVYVQGLHPSLPPPSNVTCNHGPNAPSVPAPAQKAGFTNCLINADFTSTSTDSYGTNFSNTSSYIDVCGASKAGDNTIWSGQGFNDNPFGYFSGLCSRTQIVTDPVTGTPAMDIQYQIADYANHGFAYTQLAWPSAWSGNPGSGSGPNGAQGLWALEYYQIKFRMASSILTYPSPNLIGSWWQAHCCDPGGPDYETDFFEIFGISGSTYKGGTNLHGLGNPFTTAVINQADNQYHTGGYLLTSDGTTYSVCSYLDGGIATGTPYGCGQIGVSSGGIQQNNNMLMMFWMGYCHPGYPSGSNNCASQTMDMYIQDAQIWTCPTPWNGPCYGSVITSDNAPLLHFAQRKPANDNLTPDKLIRQAIAWLRKAG